MKTKAPIPIEEVPPRGFWLRALGLVLLVGSSGLVSCQALLAL